jgi:hypothetical protein
MTSRTLKTLFLSCTLVATLGGAAAAQEISPAALVARKTITPRVLWSVSPAYPKLSALTEDGLESVIVDLGKVGLRGSGVNPVALDADSTVKVETDKAVLIAGQPAPTLSPGTYRFTLKLINMLNPTTVTWYTTTDNGPWPQLGNCTAVASCSIPAGTPPLTKVSTCSYTVTLLEPGQLRAIARVSNVAYYEGVTFERLAN